MSQSTCCWLFKRLSEDSLYVSNDNSVSYLILLCPLQVQYREEYKSFTHFLTSVCAIVGGVFTVSGLIDSFIYHGQQVGIICSLLHHG